MREIYPNRKVPPVLFGMASHEFLRIVIPHSHLHPNEPPSLESAQRIARRLQVPLPYLFADSDLLAEAILGFGLLSTTQQRKVVWVIKQVLFAQQRKARR